ncbi:relaxase/mobilization nuclease domain-containing protein [Flavobacterium collinsii]|uniref:MobA/VirD2-like nuclease domain-containing protein n=1 Tax=Flavobacterium collinsii TaxID=1114861 RepID=A0ABN7EPT3_9FLAO|nr:relaxase/mobilization nuclease domain-containing protein [Flavobacterium collinsii]CAA9202219.1 hypothetical protein FLACOL7796_04158 [Flavobacterium collinsii]
MIGLATSCNGGGALANYVLDENKGYELDRNLLCSSSPKEMVEEMKMIQDLNQRATNKTFSLVLSPHSEDGKTLSDEQLKTITRSYLNKLGIDTEKQQYVAFVHTEKKAKHVHIIANRVMPNGKLISDNHIGKKAQWIAHHLAKEHQLISAKERMFENVKNIEKGTDSLKTEIYKKHQEVLNQNPQSFQDYIKQMDLKGLEVKPTITKQGTIQGFRILDKETKNDFKASEIHRSMSGSNLIKNGLKNDLNYNLDTTLKRVQSKQISKSHCNKNLGNTIPKEIKNQVNQLSRNETKSVAQVLGKQKITQQEFKYLKTVLKPMAEIELKNTEEERLDSISKDIEYARSLQKLEDSQIVKPNNNLKLEQDYGI